VLAGLALWVGAGLHVAARPVAAQDTTRTRPPARDTTRRPVTPRDTLVMPIPQRADSSIVPDTTPQRIVRADSLETPYARAESPVAADVGLRYAWDREAFFSSGAITLLDLLDRVPGLTGFRGGWTAAPMTASYLGVPGRVRVYYDGVEVDPLVWREGGMNDLGTIQLWQLEDVVVERGASEVRVFVRSWRHERTTPNTRVDVYTGDEESNSYRGYYAKRWQNGMGLQVGAQQFSVAADPDQGGSGGGLSALVRLGWARRDWSIEGAIQSVSRSFDALVEGTRSGTGETLLPGLESRDRTAILRGSWRSPDRDGPWVQLTATGRHSTEIGERIAAASGRIPVDTVDSLASRPQYVAAAGYTLGGVRGSATLRTRAGTGSEKALLSPAFRLSVDRRWLTATALAERVERFDDSTITRVEGIARLSPASWLSLAGAVSRESGSQSLTGEGAGSVGDDGQLALRGEVGVRLSRTWVSGGVMQRGDARLVTPRMFYAGTPPANRSDTSLTGAFVALRGPLWKSFGIDAWGVRWNREDALYRPQFQSRAEVYFRTNWLRRFPSGEFGFLLAGVHEYRSNVLFPSTTEATGLGTAPQSRVLGTLLELRLQNAVISWQYRNILIERYEHVPGFVAPRPINYYGVRWDFWN
jgi:TonB-dependent Receptor Plug Domain